MRMRLAEVALPATEPLDKETRDMIFKAPAVRDRPTGGGGGAAGGQGATSEADNGKVEETLKRPLYSVTLYSKHTRALTFEMSGPKIEEDTCNMRRRIHAI